MSYHSLLDEHACKSKSFTDKNICVFISNVQQSHFNIARGTTNPGYGVCNLNQIIVRNKFEIILAEKDYSSYGPNALGLLCRWQCFLLKNGKITPNTNKFDVYFAF